MALLKSDFKNVPNTGIIPPDRLPADEFAVSFAFSYGSEVTIPDLKAELILEVRDVNDALKYLISIEEHYFFYIEPAFLEYTWNWIPQEEQIGGTIGEGDDAPPMTTLGEATFGVDPASGFGAFVPFDVPAIIDSRFYSGIFTEPLEVGDRLHIRKHTVSAGTVDARASLQIATRKGATRDAIDTLRDERTGQTWTLYNSGQSLQCASTRRLEKYALNSPSSSLAQVLNKAANFVQIIRDGATLYALAGEAGNVHICASYNEGDNWSEVMPQVPGVNILASVESERADTFYIYGLAMVAGVAGEPSEGIAAGDVIRVLLARAGVKTWKLQSMATIAPMDAPSALPKANVIRLERTGATFRLYAREKDGESDSIRILTSTNELASFSELG